MVVIAFELTTRTTSGYGRGVRAVFLAITFLAGCPFDEKDECNPLGARCDGNVAESCGFVWDNEIQGHNALHREDCGESYCTADQGEVFCALDNERDPAAPSELQESPNARGCEEGKVIEWRFGYRVRSITCAEGQLCVDQHRAGYEQDERCAGTAHCSPQAEPDPLCANHRTSACLDEQTIVICSCNYRVDAHACASPGPRCVEETIPGSDVRFGACRP